LDMRLWDAICRTLQCVPSLGLVSSVLRTSWATRSSLIGRGRPGRNSSCRPATSCSRKRCRHLPTVALVNPNWRAISRFVFPEALSKIILARLTKPGWKRTRFRQRFQLLALLGTYHQCRLRSSHRHRHLHCAQEMPLSPAILLPFIYGTLH